MYWNNNRISRYRLRGKSRLAVVTLGGKDFYIRHPDTIIRSEDNRRLLRPALSSATKKNQLMNQFNRCGGFVEFATM